MSWICEIRDWKITFVNVLSEPKTFGYAYPAALKTQFHRCLICWAKRMTEHLVGEIKKYFLKLQQKGGLFWKKCCACQHHTMQTHTTILLLCENAIVWVITFIIGYTGWRCSLDQQVRGGTLHGCGDGHSGSHHKWSRRGCLVDIGYGGRWTDGRTWWAQCTLLNVAAIILFLKRRRLARPLLQLGASYLGALTWSLN